jgi:phospholipid/cholesterol/gamma-HCH transport system substrate-binding protein
VLVGFTVLAAIGILIAGIVWLKEMSLSRAVRVWTVSFPQTGGLAPSDEVQVNGIRKGEVKSMRLQGDHVIVELELSNDVTITRDSRVLIRNVGLMGEKVIFVELAATGAPYAAGDPIPGVYEEGLGEVMAKLGETVNAMGGLSAQLSDVASTLKHNGQLERAIDNFSTTSEELKRTVSENRGLLNETLKNFAAASKTARSITTDREPQIRKAIDDFGSAAEKMDRLSGRLDSLRAVMQSLSSRVDRGEGTLGRLVTDDQLYTDLSSSVASLKGLIEDIKKHPKKYFKLSVF